MSTQSDQIDDAAAAAQQAVTDAINAGPYTTDLQAKLDAATGLLQTIDNSMMLDTQQAILDALSGVNDQLKTLNGEIAAYTTGIDKTATTIKNVSDTIGTVVSVISTVVSVGII